MKTRKLISALISIAMVISMLPMTLASAEDITITKVVSLGKTVTAYGESGGEAVQKNAETTAYLTDGNSATTWTDFASWVSTRYYPIVMDLEESQAVSKIEIVRMTTGGEKNLPLTFYASDVLYETTDQLNDPNNQANLVEIGTTTNTTEEASGGTVITDTIIPAEAAQGRYIYAKDDGTHLHTIIEITVYADEVMKDVVEQKVSVDKTPYAYSDGNLKSFSYCLTDGITARDDATNCSWINSGSDMATYIDLADTYYVSKVIVYRRSYGETNGAFGIYASENLYTTITDVKANATLVGTYSTTGGSPITIAPDSVVAGRYVYLTPDTAQGIDEIEVYAMVPRTATPISATETTTLMAEDYAADFAAAFGATEWTKDVNPWAGLSGIQQFADSYNNWMYAAGSYGAGTMSFPVSFAADGVYKFELRAGVQSQKSRDFHQYDVYLTNEDGDRVDFGGAALYNEFNYGGDGADAVGNTGSQASGSIDYKACTGKAYVEAGEYTLNIGMNTNGLGLFLHNIAVIPCGDPAQVTAEAETYLEAEDYIYGVAAATHTSAHGGTAIYDSWLESTAATATYNMPISVSEAGTYDIETVMTRVVGINTSPITVKVNGETVYTNDANGENVSGCDGDSETAETDGFLNDDFRMHKYTAAVELTEGLNNIEIVIDRAENEYEANAIDIHKFGFDYVKLAKAAEAPQNSKTEAEGVTTINVYYDAAPAGTVFAVFYNGSEVVDIARGTLTDAAATITAEITSSEYTSVKVFAWNNLMVPQADVVNF